MKVHKYIPRLFLASVAALAAYVGFSKQENISYMKFNLDDSLYVHADDPVAAEAAAAATSVSDGGCGSSSSSSGGCGGDA
jgi:uncharacterized membrane protein